MIEQWQPANTVSSPSLEILLPLLEQAEALAGGHNNDADPTTLSQLRSWTQLEESSWHGLLAQLSEQQLLDTALFFTVAEEQFGWQCGQKNPAIWAYRELKQRNQTPDKDFTRRLKSLTSNRYIPRGNIL